jgi:hypothetical protein
VEERNSSTLSLTSKLDGVGGQRHAPTLYPRERPLIHCIEEWVGLGASLDGCGKSRPPPEFDPRTVQPVASRYNDCAIPGRHSYRIWWEKLEERDHFEDLKIGGNNKMDLKLKGRGVDRICLGQDRDEIKLPVS